MTPADQKALELLKLNKISLKSYQIFTVLRQYAQPGETIEISRSQIVRHLALSAGTVSRGLEQLSATYEELGGKPLIKIFHTKDDMHNGCQSKIKIVKFS